jgi:hypothetical protein
MAALNAFARNFFKCEECAEHFTAMLDEAEAAGVVSKRDAVLWIWRTHNKVLRRPPRCTCCPAPLGAQRVGISIAGAQAMQRKMRGRPPRAPGTWHS